MRTARPLRTAPESIGWFEVREWLDENGPPAIVLALLALVAAVVVWNYGFYLPSIETTPAECAAARAVHYNDFVAGLPEDVPPEAAVRLWMASDRSTLPNEPPRLPECRHVRIP